MVTVINHENSAINRHFASTDDESLTRETRCFVVAFKVLLGFHHKVMFPERRVPFSHALGHFWQPSQWSRTLACWPQCFVVWKLGERNPRMSAGFNTTETSAAGRNKPRSVLHYTVLPPGE